MRPVTPDELSTLLSVLAGAPTWLTASQLCARLPGWNDRKIRGAAESCPKIISGQRGYRHTACATPEEITHCADWLAHQGNLMLTRARDIRAALLAPPIPTS